MQGTVSVSYSRNNEALTTSYVVTGDGAEDREIVVGNGITDEEVLFALDKDQALLLFIFSTGDVLVETNDGGAPGNAWTVKKNAPLLYVKDAGLANPILTSITKLYLTNTGLVPVTVTIRALLDSTP